MLMHKTLEQDNQCDNVNRQHGLPDAIQSFTNIRTSSSRLKHIKNQMSSAVPISFLNVHKRKCLPLCCKKCSCPSYSATPATGTTNRTQPQHRTPASALGKFSAISTYCGAPSCNLLFSSSCGDRLSPCCSIHPRSAKALQ